ncbi:MAG: ABC transporter permease [Thermoplasmata archaeon]|nr:ABC transporter permease [Thermoplasmata archaeon]
MNDIKILTIAKKEFMENWRNKWIITITAIFLILTLLASYFGSGGGETGWRSASETVAIITSFVILLIPIISLMLGYATIVGEKEKGSLGVLLSYPVSRSEVIIGKFAGLGAVVSVAIMLGFGIAGVVIGIETGSMNLGKYALFILASILFGLAYLSIAILLSTLFKKRSTAMGATIFIWFFFAMIWGIIILGILSVSGWNFIATHSMSEVNIYGDGISSFEIEGSAKSIAYGDGNVYILGDKIVEYNLSSNYTKTIKIPLMKSASSISYGNGKLYIAGDKTMIYDIKNKNWESIDVSCNDISYCDGKIYMLNFLRLTEYNGVKFKNISLPSICYSVACGKNRVYLASHSLLEYDAINETFHNYSTGGMEKIFDIAYGDGNVYILGSRSFIFNTTSKKFMNISLEGFAIAYGDGKIFTLDVKSETKLRQFPTWYYVSDFFNPIQIYRGIISLNIDVGMENFREFYPSFYNTTSLILCLLIWILSPLIASIYIFKRRDV